MRGSLYGCPANMIQPSNYLREKQESGLLPGEKNGGSYLNITRKCSSSPNVDRVSERRTLFSLSYATMTPSRTKTSSAFSSDNLPWYGCPVSKQFPSNSEEGCYWNFN